MTIREKLALMDQMKDRNARRVQEHLDRLAATEEEAD